MDCSNNGDATNGGGRTHGGASPQVGERGQAALILVESLMHALVEKGVISREDFIEIVEGGAEVEHELANANASLPSDSDGLLLSPLAHAFRKELGR